MMYALLKDGMEINEGDEIMTPFIDGRKRMWVEWVPTIGVGLKAEDCEDYPIRRKLSTVEEMQEFYKECE